MQRILLVSAALLFACSLGAVNYTVSSQSDWDNNVPEPLAFGDTVFITSSATIINTMPRTIMGAIVNDGDFTMNGTGIGITMMGAILNNANFTVGTVGLSISGEFTNVGTLNVSGAAIVIQSGGSLLNTGAVNNAIDIFNNGGTFASCSPIGGSLSGGGPSALVPMGTACDDGDDTTSNDVIVDDSCTCMGQPEEVIPTMSQWFLFITALLLLSLATVTMRTRVEVEA